MTPQEISAHAIELGITKEAFPELWECNECKRPPGWHCEQCSSWGEEYGGYTCTLPAPDSADPRCPLWDGFYMRALGWPLLRVDSSSETLRYEGMHGQFHPTPTAALRAAWLAKGASK